MASQPILCVRGRRFMERNPEIAYSLSLKMQSLFWAEIFFRLLLLYCNTNSWILLYKFNTTFTSFTQILQVFLNVFPQIRKVANDEWGIQFYVTSPGVATNYNEVNFYNKYNFTLTFLSTKTSFELRSPVQFQRLKTSCSSGTALTLSLTSVTSWKLLF